MNPNTTNVDEINQASYAAYIGFDWGDKNHALALSESLGKCECKEITHSAEELHGWLRSIGERFGGKPVAIAIESSKGAAVYAFQQYPWLVIYPINPVTSAKYRSAFVPSGAKDDLPDAKVLLELVQMHNNKFRPMELLDSQTRELAGMVEA